MVFLCLNSQPRFLYLRYVTRYILLLPYFFRLQLLRADF